MKTSRCKMCHNLLHPPDHQLPISSQITIQTQEKTKTWNVDEICASAVEEFILEFQDDVKTSFKYQNEQWKLRKNPHLQRKLPEAQA